MAVINGTNNNDTLVGKFDFSPLFVDRPDTINGLDGNDSLTGLSTNDMLNGGTGDDTLRGQGGNDTLNGGIGADNLDGGDNNDTLNGSIGNDTLNGGSGNDRIDGGTGTDTVVESGVNFTLTNSQLIGNGTDTVISIEGAILTGSSGNNILNASAFTLGSVTLNGGFGNDTLNGGFGNDSLNGGFDNDILNGGFGNDTLNGSIGNDTLNGSIGNDLYIVDSSLDKVIELAGEGIDTIESSVNYRLDANQENLVLTGSSNIAGLGNNLNNVITGNNALNTLLGDDGNDTIRGLGGNDVLIGDAGNDTLVGGEGNDRLIGTNFFLGGNGERDSLRSDSLLDTDIFILAERSSGGGKVYYSNQGNADYAVISDFDRLGVSDQIQLVGSAGNYSLSNVTVDGISGTGISFRGDLISIVQNVNASNLSLTSADQFIYV